MTKMMNEIIWTYACGDAHGWSVWTNRNDDDDDDGDGDACENQLNDRPPKKTMKMNILGGEFFLVRVYDVICGPYTT